MERAGGFRRQGRAVVGGRTFGRLAHPAFARFAHPAFARFAHPAYGILAAVAAGAIIVLAVGIGTIYTIDTSPTARSEPTYSQPTTQTAGASAQPTSAPPSAGSPTQSSSAEPSSPEPAERTVARSTQPAKSVSPTAGQTQPVRPTRSSTVGVRPPGEPASTSADAAPWVRTLQALDAQRAQAFWTLDMDALNNIYVPGSSPWTADRALLSQYRSQNVRVQGLRITIDRTTITRRTPTTITLRTTDHLTGGEAVDHTGTKTPLPPGQPTTRLITLTSNPATNTADSPDGPWRISSITQA